ncbi:MAG: type II secretion system protein, partial [Opitutales bacterium]
MTRICPTSRLGTELSVGKTRGAFTLIEVLIALAIAGLVLSAATSLLVTISRAWADRPATRDAFDAHVNGVGRFLATLMDKATMPPGSSGQTGPINLGRPIGFSDTEDPLVSFFV